MPSKPLDFEELRPDPRARRRDIRRHPHPIALLLDRVEDPRNAGALFRLADAARCAAVYGYRTGDLPGRRKVRRVARSTHQYVPFHAVEKLAELKQLQSEYALVGLDTTAQSLPYGEYRPTRPILLMVGNEVEGLGSELLELAEASIHVPMYGMNTSMNVAMAAAIAVYGLLDALGAGRQDAGPTGYPPGGP